MPILEYTYSSQCPCCDFEFTAKSQRAAAMRRRLHEKVCPEIKLKTYETQGLISKKTTRAGGMVTEVTLSDKSIEWGNHNINE